MPVSVQMCSAFVDVCVKSYSKLDHSARLSLLSAAMYQND